MLKVENYKCHWTFKLTRDRDRESIREHGEAELTANGGDGKMWKKGPGKPREEEKAFPKLFAENC